MTDTIITDACLPLWVKITEFGISDHDSMNIYPGMIATLVSNTSSNFDMTGILPEPPR